MTEEVLSNCMGLERGLLQHLDQQQDRQRNQQQGPLHAQKSNVNGHNGPTGPSVTVVSRSSTEHASQRIMQDRSQQKMNVTISATEKA